MPFIELVAQRRPPTPPPGMQPPENAKEWFRIENNADDADTTDVLIYSSIGGWFGMWADEFIEELGAVATKNINIRLNSPGGSVFDGIAIANAIRSHPANVTVYVDSLAASIASVIALAGDRLVMMPQSQIMVHNASGACYGDATEMTKMADLLDKQSRNIAEAYAQHTGRPLAEWQDYMADETWFTAEEAVTAGLADEVMPMRPKKGEEAEDPAAVGAELNRAWDLSMYNYAGREAAPAPVIPEKQTLVPGAVITASALRELSTVPAEPIVKADVRGVDAVVLDVIRDMVRQAVRDELAVIEGTACPSHSTAVKDGTWDAGANEGHLPSPVPVATVKKMYAYYDEEKVEDGAVPKSAAKLPHHFVSSDGTPGAASVNGVRNALARLPQTQGLSDAERKAAEAHLRSHLNAYGGDEDNHDGHDPIAADETEDAQPDDAPAAPPPEDPGEEQQAPSDETDPPPIEQHAPEEIPPDDGDHVTETHDEADDWNTVVGFLSAPTSPSADDVFATLKEAW
jgi:ATP-dependent Clp endopeptidase proteolytic subunit ClpP